MNKLKGASIVTDPAEATVVIAQSEKQKIDFKRSIKVPSCFWPLTHLLTAFPQAQLALTLCLPIVDLEWLHQSVDRGEALDPTPFIVHNTEAEKRFVREYLAPAMTAGAGTSLMFEALSKRTSKFLRFFAL